ncbi:MAG: phenylacetate--CoA ligase [Bacillati bacterium ANGP1]|uniref:Phenylacetate--CoA ligase n=1 Tax=Candidatus Segetimicrobium genomatis TaxID=2569760 RepID=A0A537J9R5_9BACT|nr:MAG: phenylacetate--CoA ligase [Terrabacteria group bacterium ANGP1]
MPPAEREALVVRRLQAVARWAWERSPFYRDRWTAAGVHPDHLRTLEDLRRFPVVTKADLRAEQAEHPPFGRYLCIQRSEVARIHGTSGTTGKPTAFAIGADDWRRIANAHARILWGMGLRPGDTLFLASFFSLYLGSWGALAGGERLRAGCLPFGAGVPGQTRVAVRWLLETRPTAFYGTPSYALHLAEVAGAEHVDPRDFGFRVMVFSGEPGAGIPATKRQIEEAFGAACIDSGSMAEMTPWMTNAECEFRRGMHLWQDIVYCEVCDPRTYEPVAYGAEGTPVYTHLERTSQPMIRLASGDLTRWVDGPCECGRTYPRLPLGIYGRLDDMCIIRGANIYPSAVEDVLRTIAGFGGEFQMVISRERAMDELVVRVEYGHDVARRAETAPETLDALRERIATHLRSVIGIRPVVRLEAPGTLPRTEFKARRVVDNRRLYEESVRSTPGGPG